MQLSRIWARQKFSKNQIIKKEWKEQCNILDCGLLRDSHGETSLDDTSLSFTMVKTLHGSGLMARIVDKIKIIDGSKETLKLAVRIIELWFVVTPGRSEQAEMVIFYSDGDQIHVVYKQDQLKTWKMDLKEGCTYVMHNFRVSKNDGKLSELGIEICSVLTRRSQWSSQPSGSAQLSSRETFISKSEAKTISEINNFCENLRLFLQLDIQTVNHHIMILQWTQELLQANQRSLKDYPSMPYPENANLLTHADNGLILSELNFNNEELRSEFLNLFSQMTNKRLVGLQDWWIFMGANSKNYYLNNWPSVIYGQ
ncbi:hypothetical protein JHK82_043304 [Glycine max]|nr:hypothetical protein JHK82_043304 [Glycine max]